MVLICFFHLFLQVARSLTAVSKFPSLAAFWWLCCDFWLSEHGCKRCEKGLLFPTEPGFSTKKSYLYSYEGWVLNGLQEKSLAKAGVRVSGKLEISALSETAFLLKVPGFFQACHATIHSHNCTWLVCGLGKL